MPELKDDPLLLFQQPDVEKQQLAELLKPTDIETSSAARAKDVRKKPKTFGYIRMRYTEKDAELYELILHQAGAEEVFVDRHGSTVGYHSGNG
mgnify:FL=1